PLDEIEQRLLLLGGDLGGVGVDDQAVVAGKDFRIKRLGFVGIDEVDAALLQDGLQLAEAHGRLVVAVVAEEEDFDGLRRLGGGGCGGEQGQGERERVRAGHGGVLRRGLGRRTGLTCWVPCFFYAAHPHSSPVPDL